MDSDAAIFCMPEGGTNLVWRAIELLRQSCGRNFGVDVLVQKRIPNQAGMGGGSSDAAATLVAVNRLFGLNQSPQQLRDLASQLGSDVAFFVNHGMARCSGRGELIQPLDFVPRLDLVLAMPPAGLSTAEVYQHSQLPEVPQSSGPLLQGLREGRLYQTGKGLWNRLQSAAAGLCPWIERLRTEFSRLNCRGHQMTGSGAAYFGIFANDLVARRAARLLASRLPNCFCFCVSTVGRDANLIKYQAD